MKLCFVLFFVRFCCRHCFEHSTFNSLGAFDLCSPRLWAQTAGGPWHWRIPAWTPSVSRALALHAHHDVTPLTSTHCPQQPRGRARLTYEIFSSETPGCSSVTATLCGCEQADWVYRGALIHLNHRRVSFKDGLKGVSNAKALAYAQHKYNPEKSWRQQFGKWLQMYCRPSKSTFFMEKMLDIYFAGHTI